MDRTDEIDSRIYAQLELLRDELSTEGPSSTMKTVSKDSKVEWVRIDRGLYRKVVRSDSDVEKEPSLSEIQSGLGLQVSEGDGDGVRVSGGNESDEMEIVSLFPDSATVGKGTSSLSVDQADVHHTGSANFVASDTTTLYPGGSIPSLSTSSSDLLLFSPASFLESPPSTPSTSEEDEGKDSKAFHKADYRTISDSQVSSEEEDYEESDTDSSYKNLTFRIFDRPIPESQKPSHQGASEIDGDGKGKKVAGSAFKPVSIFDEFYQGCEVAQSMAGGHFGGSEGSSSLDELVGVPKASRDFDRAVGSGRGSGINKKDSICDFRGESGGSSEKFVGVPNASQNFERAVGSGRGSVINEKDAIWESKVNGWNGKATRFNPFATALYWPSYPYPEISSFTSSIGGAPAPLLTFPIERAEVDRLTEDLDIVSSIPGLNMSV